MAQTLALRRDALRDTPSTHADIAALALAQARSAGTTSPAGRASLDLAIRESRAAIAEAPSQPFVWTGLVYALVARGVGGELGPAWRMAVRTAPEDPALIVPRLAIGFAARARLGEDGPQLLADQVRVAARLAPRDLALMARRHFLLGTVREMLAATPALRDAFDRAYLSLG